MISPEVGFRKPVTRLKSVVLPAPLGPIRPVIVPLRTSSEQPSTAFRPPKLRVRSRVSSSESASSRAGAGATAAALSDTPRRLELGTHESHLRMAHGIH